MNCEWSAHCPLHCDKAEVQSVHGDGSLSLHTRSLKYGKVMNMLTFLKITFVFSSVLSHCWLGDRKGIRPVKKLGVGLLVVTF